MALTKDELGKLLKIVERMEYAASLEQQMAQPDFWSNQDLARSVSQQYASIQKLLDRYFAAETEEQLLKLELETLLAGPHDDGSALLSIHAGAGGTEAQDWAGILARMYSRFAEQREWVVTEYDRSLGEEAGIKSITFKIDGWQAYGWLRGEAGVHRLVRMSPFDADHARHTSFALVEVIPELQDTQKVIIDEKDLRIDIYHAGGHGGQNVNKVATAVRLTHLPTGMVVACQNERSQGQNREIAMRLLRSKLAAKMEAERAQELKDLRGEYHSAEWGNQIRSYVLAPYQLVKDHRTNTETSNTEGVLDGDLTLFVEAYLRWQTQKMSNDKAQISNKIQSSKS
jgi:peptide chain release factor 2